MPFTPSPTTFGRMAALEGQLEGQQTFLLQGLHDDAWGAVRHSL